MLVSANHLGGYFDSLVDGQPIKDVPGPSADEIVDPGAADTTNANEPIELDSKDFVTSTQKKKIAKLDKLASKNANIVKQVQNVAVEEDPVKAETSTKKAVAAVKKTVAKKKTPVNKKSDSAKITSGRTKTTPKPIKKKAAPRKAKKVSDMDVEKALQDASSFDDLEL